MLPPRPLGLSDEEWLDLKIETLKLCEREGILEDTGEYEVGTLDGRLLKSMSGQKNPIALEDTKASRHSVQYDGRAS
jgi:hypothetical protein